MDYEVRQLSSRVVSALVVVVCGLLQNRQVIEVEVRLQFSSLEREREIA